MAFTIAAISLALQWAIHVSEAFTPKHDFRCQSRSVFRNTPIHPSCSATNEDRRRIVDHRRRDILECSTIFLPTLFPSLSNAAELDTSSEMNDLTRQIRASVVRGAQIIDKLDGEWERFSDDLGLGENRNQPKKKVLGVQVETKDVEAVLDEHFCLDVLNACDMVSTSFILDDFLAYHLLRFPYIKMPLDSGISSMLANCLKRIFTATSQSNEDACSKIFHKTTLLINSVITRRRIQL